MHGSHRGTSPAVRFRNGLATAILIATSHPALAGHGLNLIGFGTESIGMAGADYAVARDTAAVNINPAGLTQISQRSIDTYLEPFYTGQTGHSDDFGNDHNEIDNPLGVLFAASYAQPLKRWPTLVAGIGLFGQGGVGFAYDNMPNVFGTKDDLSSLFGVLKLASGLGWRVDDKLSLGATFGLSYATARQKLFPDTSDADAGFFGLRFDGGTALSPNFKLGVQYRPVPTITLAAVYNSKTRLTLKDATLSVNYEAIDLGHVKYRDAELEGLALPQEFGLGLAWQATPRWLVATEVNWLDWSNALKSSRLRGDNPSEQNLPEDLQSLDVRSALNWKDQYAIAIGVALQYDDKTVLRAGFDRVGNPIPRENMSPLFNIIAKNEITFGFTRTLSANRNVGVAVQYQMPQQVRYTNPNLPFGVGAREHYEVVAVMFSLGWR